MENQTIYLDEGDPRRSRFYLVFQCFLLIWIVYQGVTGLSNPDHLVLSVFLLLLAGAVVGFLTYFLLLNRDPKRRPCIKFEEPGITVKLSLYAKPLSIPRADIETIDLKPNGLEVKLKDTGRKPIRLEFSSFAINQRVKESVDAFRSGGMAVKEAPGQEA